VSEKIGPFLIISDVKRIGQEFLYWSCFYLNFYDTVEILTVLCVKE